MLKASYEVLMSKDINGSIHGFVGLAVGGSTYHPSQWVFVVMELMRASSAKERIMAGVPPMVAREFVAHLFPAVTLGTATTPAEKKHASRRGAAVYPASHVPAARAQEHPGSFVVGM